MPTTLFTKLNTWLTVGVLGAFALSSLGLQTVSTEASYVDGQKGISFQSRGPEDFASETFKQSVRNATTYGVNHVSLVVTWYQSGRGGSDLYRGWNTATDNSLREGTRFAKSLGLEVSYKLFVESNDGWRAYIQPGDKGRWFNQYQDIAVGLGQVGEQAGADLLVLGTEMVGIASAAQDPANTGYWYDLIGAVRSVYSGELTYGGNWGGAYDEKNNIEFWDALDYIGVSAYYEPGKAGAYDVASVQNFWANIDRNDLAPLSRRFGKDIIFTEVGYRSTDGALERPWDFGYGGNYNTYEQEVGYEGLLSYFQNVDYIEGLHMWDWSTDPNYGGPGNTDYTPWNKPAGQILSNYYNGTGTPAPEQPVDPEPETPVDPEPETPTTPEPEPETPTTPEPEPETPSTPINQDLVFETTVINLPENPIVGLPVELTAEVTNVSDSDAQDALVNVEIYDAAGERVFQEFVTNVDLAAGATGVYGMTWTPTAEGDYKVKVGVFSGDWQNLYSWFNEVKTIPVGIVTGGANPDEDNNDAGGEDLDMNDTDLELDEQDTEDDTDEVVSGERMIEVWWPGIGETVSGEQPFKAVLAGEELSNYYMFWQVGGDAYNWMGDSNEGYPHKESVVDLSSWNWNENGMYEITFIVQNLQGQDTHQKTVEINIAN